MSVAPLQLVRRGKIAFAEQWAEAKHRDILLLLQLASVERAVTQLTRLGELDKAVSGADSRDHALVVRAMKKGGLPKGR